MTAVVLFSTPKKPNFFLSNFYPHGLPGQSTCPIKWRDQIWPTNEHAYQASKFYSLPGKEKEYQEWIDFIRTSSTPTKAKYLGRQHTYIQYWWQKPLRDMVIKYRSLVGLLPLDDVKYDLMYEICLAKFSQHEDLKEKLLSIPCDIGENAFTDWGYFGLNYLGDILQKVRDFLKETH